ncbi:hypothetical protein KFK09_003563 [Dendrobium nobile]|uniref:Bifunctional inhibitor/plant lipid transfer protein/seed storage helical domain-containing protein n=1 Tax=Dendrobium nobile TaxID=94219 RepID=A0A8T3BY66_DENNO|nr:hypothetical protein KFK09_003563 [Dendrobium nobile]
MTRVLLLVFIFSMIIKLAEPNTKTQCGVAQTAFGMCVPYLIGWDRILSPQCCMAVRSVKELSRTPTAQNSICKCLERMVVKIGRIDQCRATSLAVRCRVHGSIIPTGNRFSCRT